MPLELVEAPAAEPVSLAEVRTQIGRASGFTDHDTMLTGMISAARELVESITGRALVTQTWDWVLDGFPGAVGRPLRLPLPPCQSVTSITYVDTAGATQTWASSLYQVDNPTGPRAQHARIQPAYGQTWPSTRREMGAVTVRFVAGYEDSGGSPAEVVDAPQPLKQALLMLIAHWYDHRDAVAALQLQPVPWAVDALLAPYTVHLFDQRVS